MSFMKQNITDHSIKAAVKKFASNTWIRDDLSTGILTTKALEPSCIS